MRKIKVKCYECGGITDNVDIVHDYRGGDFLKCPLCGAVEAGFSEVSEEVSKDGL